VGSKGAKGIQEGFALQGQAVSTPATNLPTVDIHHPRYSVLPALTLNGIIALDIVEGSYNTKRFKKFVQGLLDQMNVFPGPSSVIVMDNCRIHKSKDITDMIYER
jgi:hypothetical protein